MVHPRQSSAGIKPRSRVVYLLAAIGGMIVLMQLSGLRTTPVGTTAHGSQQQQLLQVQGPQQQQKHQVQQQLGAAGSGTGVDSAAVGLPAAVQAEQAGTLATAEAISAAAGGAATAAGSPPFRFPKLIHQTVRNKSRLSCEEKRVIQSWKTLNPGYTHQLWDDADMREFMVKYYPDLVPVPYDELLSGTERSDIWRVLVLHKFGGVYADIDVQCLKPIDEWNADHGHDASLLVGTENVDLKRQPFRIHITNWAIASMPGHPLPAMMPAVVTRAVQKQYFDAARQQLLIDSKNYEQGIINRTGPAAFTAAMYAYFGSVGFDLNRKTEADLKSKQGVMFGGVRVLPVSGLSSGWKVAEARRLRRPYSCDDVAREEPGALVCHMFWGSWRSKWHVKAIMTYDSC